MPNAVPATCSYRSVLFRTLGSTNQEGLERARQGDRGHLWIRALAQTRGRGRIGRSWASPPGNLYTSLLLVDPAEPRFAPQLGFVAGVALACAVRRLEGTPDAICLKWPNDLVHEGAKLAGILIEGAQRPGGGLACVIGFGVNCISHPEDLPYRATDLAEVTGLGQSADDLSRTLAEEMVLALAQWERGRGFGAVRERWLDLALPRGVPLRVKTSSGMTAGCFDTIDHMGRLRLSTPEGMLTVEAADVFSDLDAPPPPVLAPDLDIRI